MACSWTWTVPKDTDFWAIGLDVDVMLLGAVASSNASTGTSSSNVQERSLMELKVSKVSSGSLDDRRSTGRAELSLEAGIVHDDTSNSVLQGMPEECWRIVVRHMMMIELWFRWWLLLPARRMIVQ